MKVDLRKIRAHVAQSRSERGGGPDRRETTGMTRIIRDNLEQILRLHEEEGMTWSEIAAALGEQGVVVGPTKRPIGKSRLTAIVSQLNRQRKRDAERSAARRTRSDLPTPVAAADAVVAPRKRFALSPDLTAEAEPDRVADLPREEDLLRKAFDQKRIFLKKEPNP